MFALVKGMYCTAGTDRAREAEREDRVERRSFCFSTPLRYNRTPVFQTVHLSPHQSTEHSPKRIKWIHELLVMQERPVGPQMFSLSLL
ncbi:hypothetical protein AMELA_G00124640 [Ameiurus melas]|uniref:Uncharacterized protein n=1 Tax=Ameiurus melas TaxID=219545 RepID=A0A7J6AQ06_AMEME|nr:hypothetical protein AMELA_G00124640 [Ameiurus melas]